MKKITITGHVGKDPSQIFAPNGDSYTVFSLAVTSGPKDNKKTDWFEIICNGKNADIVKEHVSKGTRLLIDGTPSVNAWVSREGKPMGNIRVFAAYIEFIGSKQQEDDKSEEADVNDDVDSNNSDVESDENVPFSQ